METTEEEQFWRWKRWRTKFGMFFSIYYTSRASLVAQTLERLPAVQETWVRSLGWEDPLEKEMATHSSILAWRIPWTEDPGRLQSMGLQRVRHDWLTSLYIKVEILLSPGVSKNTLTFNISFKVWGSTRSSSLLTPSAITVYHYSLWQGYRIRSAKRRGKWADSRKDLPSGSSCLLPTTVL